MHNLPFGGFTNKLYKKYLTKIFTQSTRLVYSLPAHLLVSPSSNIVKKLFGMKCVLSVPFRSPFFDRKCMKYFCKLFLCTSLNI